MLGKNIKISSLLFFSALFLFFLLPPTDPDLGWQLKCGQFIWQGKGFCSQNQFTVLLESYQWANHHWGYQAILYPIYQNFGFWGLSFFNAGVVGLAFLFFYLSIKNFKLEKIAAILVITFLGWGVFSFGARSQLMGFLFFDLMLWLFSKIKENPKVAWFLPIVMLLWANTHGSFVLGMVLLAFFVTAASLNQSKFNFSFLPLVISFLVTLLNPFGLQIYQEAFRHLAGPIDLSHLVAEWVSPNPSFWWLILVSGVGAFFYLLLTAKNKEVVLSFLILPFMFLGLKARRHVPIYFVTFFYLLLNSSHLKKLATSRLAHKTLRKNLVLLVALILFFVSLTFRLPQTFEANASWQGYCQASDLNYPCEAIEYLQNQGENQGAIFNRYEWGGFLIWQLPKHKIFVDGRMPAWEHPSGKSPYTIYLETLQAQPGWENTLANYDIHWILISPGTFLDLKLKEDPPSFGWQEVFRNPTSVLYKKSA